VGAVGLRCGPALDAGDGGGNQEKRQTCLSCAYF
jgi:hypothetical protein